uniref:GST C-terminal domain-containing protein n=1 Tax=Cyanistes caeruleus TaxID=156563 RepID=A0A8C0VSI8_CYACU
MKLLTLEFKKKQTTSQRRNKAQVVMYALLDSTHYVKLIKGKAVCNCNAATCLLPALPKPAANKLVCPEAGFISHRLFPTSHLYSNVDTATVMEGLSTSLKQFEERFLQDKAFIIGSEISLADLVAIVELMQPVGVGCDIFEDRPRLREWRRRVEDAVGKELFFQAHEMILNIKELSNIQIDPQLKEQLAPVLMKMLK